MTRMESFDDAAVGRREERKGCLTPNLAGMLGAAIGNAHSARPDLSPGAEMPHLWHWAAFPTFSPHSDLGEDGHPRPGGFLPRLPYPRRMWAGGALSFDGRLSIGEPLVLRSEIRKVSEKDGAAGKMAFVTIRHVVEGAEGGRITEDQDIVYLGIPESFRPPRPVPPPERLDFEEPVPVDEVRLFRFSAATFNAHRIHYDLTFAREVEKYPALVVHGPMQALMLMEAGERHTGRSASRFSFRGLHPMFHDHALHLGGVVQAAGSAIDLATIAPTGHVGLQAKMEWAA